MLFFIFFAVATRYSPVCLSKMLPNWNLGVVLFFLLLVSFFFFFASFKWCVFVCTVVFLYALICFICDYFLFLLSTGCDRMKITHEGMYLCAGLCLFQAHFPPVVINFLRHSPLLLNTVCDCMLITHGHCPSVTVQYPSRNPNVLVKIHVLCCVVVDMSRG